MELDKVLDILKNMTDELIAIDKDGSCQRVTNKYGRSKGLNIYCIFGDIIITDEYAYISIKVSKIPKDLNIRVNKKSVTFMYNNKSKNIKLSCRLEKLVKFDTKGNIIDIKMKR